jgi:hypothetical protein
MKVFLILALAISINHCYAQSDYRKAWNKDTPLTWDDFKGPADETSEFKAFTRYNEYYQYKWKLIGGKYSFTFDVTSKLHQDQSWSKTDYQTPELLKHEQIHFDISEFFARKLLFALNHYTYTDAFKEEIAIISSSYNKMRNVMENQYDDDTRHGTLKKRQLAWEDYVAELLNQDSALEDALKVAPNIKR